MFMKCIDGIGLVKLGKIALALLPRSALLHGEDENGQINSFCLWIQWEKDTEVSLELFYLYFNASLGTEGEGVKRLSIKGFQTLSALYSTCTKQNSK